MLVNCATARDDQVLEELKKSTLVSEKNHPETKTSATFLEAQLARTWVFEITGITINNQLGADKRHLETWSLHLCVKENMPGHQRDVEH